VTMLVSTRSITLRQGLTPDRLFLLIGLAFGVLFVFITPPFQVPDEYHHFYRSYHVSEGRILGIKDGNLAGDYLPRGLGWFATNVSSGMQFHPEVKQDYHNILSQVGKSLHLDNRAFFNFHGSVLYSPVPYLPQAAAMLWGRIFSGSPLALFYMGRLANVAVWALLTALAIRVTPIYKWVFFLLALAPMSIFQAASLSADALTHALSFLLVAIILYLAFGPLQSLSRKELVALLIVSVLLALCKPGYILLLGMFFLIPVRKFGSFKRYLGWAAILFSVSLGAMLGWLLLARPLYVSTLSDPAINPGEQLLYILENPIAYIKVILRTFRNYRLSITTTYIGVLGWLDTPLPGFVYNAFIILTIMAALLEGRREVCLTLPNKLVIALLFGAGVVYMSTLPYLTWTPVGSRTIEGMQGRYFIPFGPPALLLLYNRFLGQKIAAANFLIKPIATIGSLVILIVTVYALLLRYYPLS